jgi:hypothetical protein
VKELSAPRPSAPLSLNPTSASLLLPLLLSSLAGSYKYFAVCAFALPSQHFPEEALRGGLVIGRAVVVVRRLVKIFPLPGSGSHPSSLTTLPLLLLLLLPPLLVYPLSFHRQPGNQHRERGNEWTLDESGAHSLLVFRRPPVQLSVYCCTPLPPVPGVSSLYPSCSLDSCRAVHVEPPGR